MNQLAPNPLENIAAMNPEHVEVVRELEREILARPQSHVVTRHLIHGGVYLRSMNLPRGCVVTGALIKINTTLIISGAVTVYVGGRTLLFEGYNVVPASGGRKQAILAHEDSNLTMLFPTQATTVEDAEAEFTDEVDLLASRGADGDNLVKITGQ